MNKREKKIAMKLMIPPSLLQLVKTEARKRGVSMNAFVRECVKDKITTSSGS